MKELLQWSGLEIARRIRQREISSEEATRFFLRRIERHNGHLTAFVTVLERSALRAARAKDKQLSKTRDVEGLPTFFGVPVGLKDLVPMRGTPTKFGSRAYSWMVAPFDGAAAKRMKKGGFVIVGKLATSEFGVMPVTEPDIHAPTRNPWNTDHTPGGSSGGSGSAVAAGLVPLAHGSDGGGSVRIPASFCHLYGYKPSLSLLGNMHGDVNQTGISTMGPLTHHVSDAAAFLDVLAGRLHHRNFGRDSCLSQCDRPPPKLRVAMITGSPLGHIDPARAAAVRKIGSLLEELGHEVSEVETIQATVDDFLPVWQFQIAGVPVYSDRPLQPVTRWLRRDGRNRNLDEVLRVRDSLATRMAAMFADADVMLSATTPVPPPRVGAYTSLPPKEQFEAIADIGALTAGYNASLSPAANFPAGLDEDGLPIVVQIGARPGHDYLLLSLSKQLEEAMSWRDRRSAVFGAS